MFKKVIATGAAILSLSAASFAEGNEMPAENPITFTSGSGESVAAFEGSFQVPENRRKKDSREITISYVRFPATGEKAGAPIVYLAGGPGGSGIATAKGRRFSLFMAMREFGDVIALDQRGTGASDDTPRCRSSVVVPADQPLSDEEYTELHRASIAECQTFWTEAGVDFAGYTTEQSVHDLDDLREHLGAEKLTLWGISYGSHLSLAALKEMDNRIEKVVITGAEGLDQTVKLPARTDAYFDRLQAAIDTDPDVRMAYPDLKGLMHRVHAKLDAEPVKIKVPQRESAPADFLLTRWTMQRVTSFSIADPSSALRLPGLYTAVDNGIYEPVAGVLSRFYRKDEPISWRVMPLAMDVASGIGDDRLVLVREQAGSSLLGEYLNFPMPQVWGSLDGLDLGDAFRMPPKSDVPTLLLSGTLDGRTYVESQLEAVSGLSNLTHITVVNAGHNLFMSSPEVTEVIQLFMRGEPVGREEIVIPLPDFGQQ